MRKLLAAFWKALIAVTVLALVLVIIPVAMVALLTPGEVFATLGVLVLVTISTCLFYSDQPERK